MTIYIVFKESCYRDYGDLYSNHTPKIKSNGFDPEKAFPSLKEALNYVAIKDGHNGNRRKIKKFSFDWKNDVN